MLFVAALALVVPLAGPHPTCSTMALRELPAGAGFDIGFGGRPDDVVEVVDSTLHPLRVHRSGGATAAQAALVLAELDAAWASQVDVAGFPPPLPDDTGEFADAGGDGGDERVDVYLSDLLPGVFAITVSGGTASQRPVFIQIDPQQPDELLAVAAHHEFQHAVQFAVDARESVMWFESNAVAWEVKGRPDVDAWLTLLPSFQQQAQAPIFTDAFSFAPFATTRDDTYEYGAALFVLFLDDVYGAGDGVFLRELWQASAQAGTDNEPDWLDALGARPEVESDGGVAGVLADFAGWRALTGSLDVDDDGPTLVTDGQASLAGRSVLLASLAGLERETDLAEGPFVGGCSVHIGVAPRDEDVPVRVRARSAAEAGAHDLVIAATVVDVAARTSSRTRSDVAAVVEIDVAVPRGQTLVASICDVSVVDADAQPEFAPIFLRLSRSDVGEGEGEIGEGEGEGASEGEGEGKGEATDCGCACQGAGDPRGMRQNIGIMGLSVGVFALALRGYRLWRRSRLYRSKQAARDAASLSSSSSTTPPR